MRIVITGSSGQIGSNLALRLLEEGHEVLGIDVRDNTWTDRIRLAKLDLTSDCTDALEKLFTAEKFDAVMHLAAHAKVYELVVHPERALENVLMLFHTLDAARRARLPLLFGSSREVYGDIHKHLTDEGCADFVIAESPYSASKISGEAYIYSYQRCYGLPYLVFRFSNVYGRFDNDIERMERVIPLFIDRLSQQQPITIYGKEKVLDFTYVDDCVRGIIQGITALVERRVENRTINLAYGKGNTLEFLAECISKTLGVEPDVSFLPSQKGEVTRYVADIGQARELLGYQPRVSLAEGIPLAIAWARGFAAEAARTP